MARAGGRQRCARGAFPRGARTVGCTVSAKVLSRGVKHRTGRVLYKFKGQGQGWGHFLPTFDSSLAFTPRRHGLRRHLSESGSVLRRVSRVTRHTASASRRRACRREAPRPDRLARDKPTNTPHGACQLGEGQAVSSLAFERRLSHSLCSVQSHHTTCTLCASAPRDSNCGLSHTM